MPAITRFPKRCWCAATVGGRSFKIETKLPGQPACGATFEALWTVVAERPSSVAVLRRVDSGDTALGRAERGGLKASHHARKRCRASLATVVQKRFRRRSATYSRTESAVFVPNFLRSARCAM